jgi:hypothetical protein
MQGETKMTSRGGASAWALGLALAVHLSGGASAQQVQFACDANSDGSVDATESRQCTDAEFDRIAPAGTAGLTAEQLSAATMSGQGDRRQRRWYGLAR